MNKVATILVVLGFILVVLGVLFKFLHLMGGAMATYIGVPLLIIGIILKLVTRVSGKK